MVFNCNISKGIFYLHRKTMDTDDSQREGNGADEDNAFRERLKLDRERALKRNIEKENASKDAKRKKMAEYQKKRYWDLKKKTRS